MNQDQNQDLLTKDIKTPDLIRLKWFWTLSETKESET